MRPDGRSSGLAPRVGTTLASRSANLGAPRASAACGFQAEILPAGPARHQRYSSQDTIATNCGDGRCPTRTGRLPACKAHAAAAVYYVGRRIAASFAVAAPRRGSYVAICCGLALPRCFQIRAPPGWRLTLGSSCLRSRTAVLRSRLFCFSTGGGASWALVETLASTREAVATGRGTLPDARPRGGCLPSSCFRPLRACRLSLERARYQAEAEARPGKTVPAGGHIDDAGRPPNPRQPDLAERALLQSS